ncbi:MAG: DUF1553 domain-containing protein [Planctomycetes bacterium]|nr:DUF1553 domain-containing protein [Planctomycetota bacterium]
MRPRLLSLAVLVAAVARTAPGGDVAPPSFTLDVVPILSKAGCNGGGCHGALAGKGGLRLSLFGYDPAADHRAITRDALGRRVDRADPGASLLLAKPTTAVAHKGGRRLDPDGPDYALLAAWIGAGGPGPDPGERRLTAIEVSPAEASLAPGTTAPLTVTATYSDGSRRDVTPHTRFAATDEAVATVDPAGSVTVVGPGAGGVTAWYSSRVAVARIVAPFAHDVPAAVFAAAPRANVIDELVLEQLAALHLEPSPACDDATFVRRAFVDTIGRLPTPEEVRRFLADTAPGKHERLVELLLARPEFVDYWAWKWSDLLLVTGSKLRPPAVAAYHRWIRDRVADGTPWDEFARRVVTAKGSSAVDGATNFFAVHQDPEAMAENVSQAFLGLSIGCAKCHDHPLEKWTNDQYYAFANLFARVRAKGWGGDARNGDGQRTLYVESSGDLIQPRTGRPQPPAPLDGTPLPADFTGDRREALAAWLTSPDNPSFTRAIVNRVWANFFSVGLVEPVDDLRATNPAANEKLLSALADHLVAHRYDLKALMRLILASHTYRRSAVALPTNAGDRRSFARAYPRRLAAEVLADAIADVTGVRDAFTEIALNDGSTEKTTAYGADTRALQVADAAVKSPFLATFGRNPRDITCECERSNQPSLVQVLALSNGAAINDKLAAKGGRITQFLATDPPPLRIVEQAWLECLSRLPTDGERKSFEELLAAAPAEERRAVVEDLYWSLLTSREFLFRH